MAGKVQPLDQLISAFAGAVADAQFITKQSQLNDLKNYFYERDREELEAEANKALKEAVAADKKARQVKEKGGDAEAERLFTEAESKRTEAERLKTEAGIKHYIPKTVYISCQSVRPSAKAGDLDTVRVPLITLVKPVQHSIEEMNVSMNVEFGQITETKRKVMGRQKNSEQNGDWAVYEEKASINVSTSSIKHSDAVGVAHVTIRVRADEVQEGLARLIDNLYKVL